MVTMIQEDSDDDGPILYRDDDDDEMEDEGKQIWYFRFRFSFVRHNFAFPFPFLIRAPYNEKKIVKSTRQYIVMMTGPYFIEMTTMTKWKTKVNII